MEIGSAVYKSLLKQDNIEQCTEYDRFTKTLDSMGIYWEDGYVFLKDVKGTQKVEIGSTCFVFVNGSFVEWIGDGEVRSIEGRCDVS